MYNAATTTQRILSKTPLFIIFFLGEIIGTFLYLNRKKREIAYKNIKSVFPAKTNREIKRIVKLSFRSLGLGILESLVAGRIFPFVELKGMENIADDGGILVAIHEGSWELYNFFIAKELKYKMFAKEQKKKSLDLFLTELRKKYSLNLCFSLKDALYSLKNNYLLGMVVDHGAEDNALFVNFFSHLVPTPKGAVYLARKLNKKIYPCFGYRRSGFSHTIEIGKPIEPDSKTDHELLSELNGIYENYLTKYPWEYLWYYKRFKRKKDMDILILSDRKAGHLKQSQAFLSFFKEEDFKIRSQTIEIKMTNGLQRFASEIIAFLSGRYLLGRSLLGFFLDSDTCKKLQETYADIVVSTGSIAAPVNRIVSSMIGAKSVVILRPNTPLRKFDLCIIPTHDRINTKNTATIKGALSYPLDVEEKAKKCKNFFKLSNTKKIAVFLGGHLSNEKVYLDNLKLFLQKLKIFSSENDYKILLSTSRRTQKNIEEWIEKELKTFPNTEAIVIPSRANYDFAFEGFVELSEMVFVSGESISMISETLALKKPCVCVLFENHIDKHNVFLESIEKDVNLLDNPYNISGIKLIASPVFEENRKIVRDAIRGLL
ncbi:MAG: ELM1/GtrOC1 family putative glycosyltransferase [Candidatus Omnitrophota bacterium]|jgi:lauroyl/myristoyl acyltransferase/mitochondrial fission protein ELM1